MAVHQRYLGVLTALLVLTSMPSGAAELGHYAPAVPRARDFFVPGEKGVYYAQYNTYYTAGTYKNGNGDKVNSVNVGGVNINVKADVDSYMVSPGLLVVTDKKILGATYGFYFLQPMGNMGLDAALSTLDRGISTSSSSFGIGDTFIQPLWLGWAMKHDDAVLGYGVYLPTGKYKVGSSGNIGLGYWTHQFQGGWAHYFDDHKMTALTGAVTYEINSNKQDTDIKPGSRASFNAGLDHMWPISNSWIGNVGVDGYGQWQVSRDGGDNATRKGVKDQVYGTALNAGVTYLPWGGAQASFKWAHEMGAQDRFEGDYYQLTLGIPF